MMCSTQMIVTPSSRQIRRRRSAAWSISCSSRPLRLSSASSSFGSVASALASSSFFRAAAPRPSTVAARSVDRPTRPSAFSAASNAFARECRPWPKNPASTTLSTSESRRNGRGIWNVRPMPRLMMRYGGCPAISRPSNLIEPALGASVPESMLKMVLWPERLGPIRPTISPFSTPNDTPLTAVKPPKRLVRPWTASKNARPRDSLRRVRRRARQRHDRLALLLALGPDEIGLVVDVLKDDRERAIVLPRHELGLALELHAEAQHGAAFRQIHFERGFPERIGVDAAVLLDGARQSLGHEHVGVARRHAHVRRAHLRAGPRLLVLFPDHLDHGGQRRAQRLLVREPDRDRVDVEEVVHVAPE